MIPLTPHIKKQFVYSRMSPKSELCLSQDPLLLPAAGRDSDWPLRARPLPGLCVREGGAGGQAGAAQPRHEGGHQD